MANLGTERLKIVNDQPSVTKLWNDRYRLEFYLDNDGKKEDWYAGNIGNILPAFGTLQAEQFGIGNWLPREDEAYDNMRCISASTEYVPAANKHYVKLVYETLSDTFVAEEDDTTEYSANGLKRITRRLISESGVSYGGTVGLTQEDGLYLSAYKIEDTDAYRRVEEVWVEAGILSQTEDLIGSQKAISIESIGPDPIAPSGYSVASKQESEYQGLQTNRFTFLKDNVELSRSEDLVASQKAIVIEQYNGTPATPSGYALASTQVSDVEGVPTRRYTFLKSDTTLSQSEDLVGSQLAIVIEQFDGVPSTPTGYSIANKQESDVDGVKTNRYTFLKDDVELSRSEDMVGSQLAITTEVFNPAADPVEAGYSLARTDVSEVDGIPTKRFTFLKDEAILSVSQDNVGSQLSVTNEVFNPATDSITGVDVSGAALSGYSEAGRQKSDFNGIPTIRYTFLKNNVKLSESEDKVGSQLAKVEEWFNPESEPSITDYVIASVQKSNVSGIPTERYTFLKEGVKLSESEDKVGSQNAITEEWFKPGEGSETKADYSLARTEASDIGGIPTERYTFLKDNATLSVSQDRVGSQLAVTNEVFKPTSETYAGVDIDGIALVDYSEANRQKSDFNGIPTIRYTFLKEDVELSSSEDKVGSQNAITEEWFKPTPDRKTKTDYSLAREEVSDVEGIPTERYTFLKDNTTLSVSEDRVGSQLAVINEVFNPTLESFIGIDIEGAPLVDYLEASRQKSDFAGVPTIRYTFLREDVQLSESEDKVGSQLAITEEWFKPTEARELKADYSLARKEASDVSGIPTERYTFLKNNVKLSESEDKVGSQLAKVEEWFKPDAEPSIDDYVIASVQKSDVGGIPTERYTFLKENVELSRSEDFTGSQLSITTEVFKPSAPIEIADYSLSRSEVSDVAGIPTSRLTFLKDNVTLSVSQDRVGSQLAVVNEVFNPATDSITGVDVVGAALVDYSEANRQKSDFNGIPTIRYTFLKDDVQLSSSEDKVGSQLAITEEWFKPAEGRELKADYSLAREEVSDVDGIPTKRYTFLKDDTQLSLSEDKVGSQLAITEEWFKPSEGRDVKTDYSIARKEVSDVDGIPTIRYTFLKNNATLSVSQDNIGSQLAVTNEVFNPDLESITGVDVSGVALVDYSEANRQKSDFNGIPTIRYTFLKDDAELSRSEDLVGSQLSIITEVFNPTSDPVEENYSIARKDISDVDGIPTVRYTFLKDGAILSVSQDNAEGKLTIINEVFNPEVESITGVDVNGLELEDYSEASRQKSDFGGIPTFRYTFIKAGIISTKEDNGPQGLPNTKTRQYVSLIHEPTNDGGGTDTYDGILLSKSIDNFGGLPVYTYTYLEGDTVGSSPTGEGTLLQEYNKYIEVRKAGEISASTVPAPAGASGNTAVLSVVPPSIKKVSATITVDLLTSATPPTLDATPAFDLSEVSASASITTTRRSPVGVEQGGSLSISVFNVRVNSETRSYPNHFFTAPASVSGTISSPSHIVRDDDSIIGEALDETTSTNINFTGSDTAPLEEGIYQQDVEPVFVDADGNQYYRKTTYTV